MDTNDCWTVYILRCFDDTLYTGITKDLKRRLKQHNDAVASRYTRARLPVKLVYRELELSQGDALRREIAIKNLSRSDKEKLIQR